MGYFNRFAAAAALVALAATAASAADAPAGGIVPGTVVKVHLQQATSSNRVRTGDPIALIVAEDVQIDGKTVIAKDTPAVGRVDLAGIAGINGHEGNLKIVAVSTRGVAGQTIPLAGRVEADGKQRKALAFFTTRWIRGDDVSIAAETVFNALVIDEATASANAAAAAANAPPPAPAAPAASPAP
jgi:ABC-type phosphate/phosphonate transport system substrate-binding protein